MSKIYSTLQCFSSFYWSSQHQDSFLNVLDNVSPFPFSVHPLIIHFLS